MACEFPRLLVSGLSKRGFCESSTMKSQPNGQVSRCRWAKSQRMIAYHDQEWGVPVHDDRVLFEFLILEGAQAGLSWETILQKRENYRRAFDGFQAARIARYDGKKTRQLLQDAGIVRNRLKIAATVSNARAFLAVQRELGSFDRYIWQFAPPQKKQATAGAQALVTRTPESDAMSKDLRKRGFRFVGTTICYAFMQAVGMVDDHDAQCFRSARLRPPKLEA